MAIKNLNSIVSHIGYPKIARYIHDDDQKEGQFIVLMLSESGNAVVLESNDKNYNVGEYDTFSPEDYEPYNEKVTIQNM